jgi:glycosyltransferase involved in cell wall biosynthesis
MLSDVSSPAAPSPRLTIVIPAYNEARYLPRLIDSIEAAKRAWGQGDAAVETIVADNASTDGTAEVALARGCRVVPVAKRAIAAARNAGGQAARGEIVCFVDADMTIHPKTFGAIEEALASNGVVGGATGVTLERWSAGLTVTYALFVPLVWVTRFDTGVVFCRRQGFLATGGYDETLRVAEDVAFLYVLRKFGRGRRQRLTRLRGVKAVASTRKFDELGDWHTFTTMPRLALAHLFRRAEAVREAERYWYDPGR